MGTYTFVGTPIADTTAPNVDSATRMVYCTFDEICDDLGLPGGDVAAIMRNIRAASQTIQQEIGYFIPLLAARRFDGKGQDMLMIPPFLEASSVVDDTTTYAATDYLLYPRGRHWENGPYSRILHDPDGNYTVWTEEKDIVVITGWWGLWSKYEDTTADVGTGGQSSVATTLLVTDGSKVSPGMVLLLESEQQLVTGYSTPSLAVTTTNEALDISEEEVTVTDGTKVSVGEIIRVEFEQMKVLDIRTNSLYVRRGWNNTTKATHTTSANVDAYRTFTVEREVNGTTKVTHAAGTAVQRYLVPDDVNFLTREIATLMMKKAQGGFAGKTGNAELGETYYHDAFPRFDIERVKMHYEI